MTEDYHKANKAFKECPHPKISAYRNCQGPFQYVSHEGEGSRPLSERPQDICCADIPAADLFKISTPLVFATIIPKGIESQNKGDQ